MNNTFFSANPFNLIQNQELIVRPNLFGLNYTTTTTITPAVSEDYQHLPEILFVTSYPPRECGIATYSLDLMNAIKDKFGESFSLKVCALECQDCKHQYPEEVKYVLQTADFEQYEEVARQINADCNIKMVFVEHEFGLFGGTYGDYLLYFLAQIDKPIITTFHTVLPNPSASRKEVVRAIVEMSESVVVMTKNATNILENDYGVSAKKIALIPHGTHLVSSSDNLAKKAEKNLKGRKILSTFGLLGSGKSIETALEALPAIVEEFPNVMYLIIGKTHPSIVKNEGEKYRNFLYAKVDELKLKDNVRFINKYLSLNELLEYLQMTDIYLFTSKDPHQAVSGTFAYAMACGCPVISTPIPHAKEFLDGAGVIVDFQDAKQLANATIHLLSDANLLHEMKLNALHKINPTAWQNSAISHLELMLQNLNNQDIKLKYTLPEISLAHINRLTTSDGMIQFSSIATPDLATGYTIDDNARALIAVTKHYQLTGEHTDLTLIETYLNFIIYCQQKDGSFLNYVDEHGRFFEKNKDENLEDANGRAIWALGEFISYHHLFHSDMIEKATVAIEKTLKYIPKFHSPRAIAFSIKGLYHYDLVVNKPDTLQLITTLADNLISKYRGVSGNDWQWFEEYLTYANSVLPEAMLYAYLSTGSKLFRTVAKSSFDFLLSIIFRQEKIKVVSNIGWHLKGQATNQFGEQPIDVAYTVLALGVFYDTFKEETYKVKMEIAFDWFLGKNHLHQTVYNPCTGGCYDGLEEKHINLNQGAESTVSYLMARLTMEKYFNDDLILTENHQLYQNENNLQLFEALAHS